MPASPKHMPSRMDPEEGQSLVGTSLGRSAIRPHARAEREEEEHQRRTWSPWGLRSMRPDWHGWHLPTFSSDRTPIFAARLGLGLREHEEDEVLDFEELPAIEENQPLILPADEEWLYEEDEGLSGAGSRHSVVDKERKDGVLTLWSLVGIMYFASSGGPEGTEGLIAAAGPGGAILGIAAAAVVWSMPIALMSAELGTVVPENGGCVVWARAAFGAGTAHGDFLAFLVGWCNFLFTAVDGALYPAMFVSYLIAGSGVSFSPEVVLGIKLAFTGALVIHNCAGVGAIGESAKVMIVTLLLPFVVFSVVAFSGVAGWPRDMHAWVLVAPQPKYGDTVLLLAWNLGMWEAACACAGEVKDPARTIPKALAIVVVFVVMNYILPIMAFTVVDSEWQSYANGYYVEIAFKLGGPLFAAALAFGQCISTAGLFENALAHNSYMLCGMSEQTLLPRIFQVRWVRTDAPVVAIGLSTLISGVFVVMSDFSAGVFLIPFFLPCVSTCFFIAYVTPTESFIAAGVMVCIGLALYSVMLILRGSTPQAFQQAASLVPDLLETPASSRLNTPAPSAQGSVRAAESYAGSFYVRSAAGSHIGSEVGSWAAQEASLRGSVSSVGSRASVRGVSRDASNNFDDDDTQMFAHTSSSSFRGNPRSLSVDAGASTGPQSTVQAEGARRSLPGLTAVTTEL